MALGDNPIRPEDLELYPYPPSPFGDPPERYVALYDEEDEYVDLAMGLALLMRKQTPFLVDLGHNNDDPDTLARYGAALMIEVAEFVNELPWKVWRSRAVDSDPDLTELRSRVLHEWVDVLHFVGTWQALLWYFSITPEETAAAFQTTNERNAQRRAELRSVRDGTWVPNGVE